MITSSGGVCGRLLLDGGGVSPRGLGRLLQRLERPLVDALGVVVAEEAVDAVWVDDPGQLPPQQRSVEPVPQAVDAPLGEKERNEPLECIVVVG
jgi:hypothetical protein